MAETLHTSDDEGIERGDRPRALGLIFRRHGRENVRPTVPTRVQIYRDRTSRTEAWEVIAWLPVHGEFVVWRRDTHLDFRLKAKEFAADLDGRFAGLPIPLADQWDDEPLDDEEDEPPPSD